MQLREHYYSFEDASGQRKGRRRTAMSDLAMTATDDEGEDA